MHYGKTLVDVAADAAELGERAASAIATVMRERLAQADEVRMILAGGESQTAFLERLAVEPDLDWQRVACFNMDDFWDLRLPQEYSVGQFTITKLYEKVRPKATHLVRYNAPGPEAEADRYEALVRAAGPIDILCQGIGRSGHLAFNEPGQTDFEDSRWVRVVDLVDTSKQQLLEDPSFMGLGYIPEKGITMTIPAMLSATHVFTMVPYSSKRPIVTRVLATKEPTPDLPASILSRYEGTLFLDRDSYPEDGIV
jgi:glucosamine-6-phosphate deaminase